jgi:excinuclease ABC subunit B
MVMSREKQVAHNTKHGITPTTIKKAVARIIEKETGFGKGRGQKRSEKYTLHDGSQQEMLMSPAALSKHITKLRKEMQEAASNLEFEAAANIRDQIKKLEAADLGI